MSCTCCCFHQIFLEKREPTTDWCLVETESVVQHRQYFFSSNCTASNIYIYTIWYSFRTRRRFLTAAQPNCITASAVLHSVDLCASPINSELIEKSVESSHPIAAQFDRRKQKHKKNRDCIFTSHVTMYILAVHGSRDLEFHLFQNLFRTSAPRAPPPNISPLFVKQKRQ